MELLDVIHTPDQRLRVFVSSTLGELTAERAAVKAAVENLRMTPAMFELGARPHPPRELYRAYLKQSHIFVGIYWQSYGWIAPDMSISGIEDEYDLAASLPCLLYLKDPAPQREPRLADFLQRVEREGRVSYKRFQTAEQLAGLVSDDLAVLLAERFEADSGTARPATPLPRPSALPVPPTRLIDRDRELEAIAALIQRDDVRLVTLCGMGGIGKTRLAIAVAGQLAAAFTDGVAFVDLASLGDPALVAGAIATALNVAREGRRPLAELLIERLRRAQVLLILDNFEQLLEATPLVSSLLAACPQVKVLATSRALLRLRGEHEFPVVPLAVPATGAPVTTTGASASPAVRLFVDRAEEHLPGFVLADANAGAVAELCSRLEGIPLAIELAAARVRVLPPGALLGRLGERLDLLSGPADLPERQRTLRATLDWSYRLLDQQERRLFDRLSVFVGGFTLDSAQAVCGGDGISDVLDGVSSLIDKSLVLPQQREDAVDLRFRMLETVRTYGQSQLEQGGTAHETRRRMARYLAEVAEQAAGGLMASGHRLWLSRLDAEIDNLRAALSWADDNHEPELLLRIAVRPWIYWWTRGYIPEMRPLIERCLKEHPALDPASRALQLYAVASARNITGDAEAAIPLLRELMELELARGDEHGLALARWEYCSISQDEPVAELRAILTDAAATLRRLGDRWVAAAALSLLGTLALHDGDPTGAERIGQEALAQARATDSEAATGLVFDLLGRVALARGDIGLARARFSEGVRAYQRIQDREGISYALYGLAAVALARGRPELAAAAVGVADATRDSLGVGMYPFVQRTVRGPLIAAVQAALGREVFDDAWRAGRETDASQAIEELLRLTA